MKCLKPHRGLYTPKELKKRHKVEMLLRRGRQLSRTPDDDARITYFSKNSLPEYRKCSSL